jgi:deoxyhypusine synthase
MAFDLVIGKSALVKDRPVIFGSIEWKDYIAIARLQKKHPNWFLSKMSNIFDDQCFGAEELTQAAEILDDLILMTRESEDCNILMKMSAAAVPGGHNSYSSHNSHF